MAAILALKAATFEWLAYHKRNHRRIEALACAIRLKALNDAIRALEKEDST